MKIFDGFLFNDEFDLLELRLMELGDVVDRFVLIESPLTFQQKTKPLHWNEAVHGGGDYWRFSKWVGKIHHVIADTPNEPHPVIEHESRRQILRGFDAAKFNDMILLGDVDEIPSRESIEFIRETPPAQPMVMRQHLYYYRVTNHIGYWNGTIVNPRGLGKMDLQRLRDHRNVLPVLPVETGGWHFSWMGDAEDVKHKLRCIDVKRDSELYGSPSSLPNIPDPDEDSERVDRIVAVGDDLFGRDKSLSTQPIMPGVLQPACIEEWLKGKEKYA